MNLDIREVNVDDFKEISRIRKMAGVKEIFICMNIGL